MFKVEGAAPVLAIPVARPIFTPVLVMHDPSLVGVDPVFTVHEVTEFVFVSKSIITNAVPPEIPLVLGPSTLPPAHS